jgi:hypothetical protein
MDLRFVHPLIAFCGLFVTGFTLCLACLVADCVAAVSSSVAVLGCAAAFVRELDFDAVD